jgi:phosphotransferase family enzyme
MAHSLRFVIPDGRSAALLVEGNDGWALPRVTSEEPEEFLDVARTLRAIAGEDVFVLRDVRLGPSPEEGPSIWYLTEPVLYPSAATGRWITRDDLPTVQIADERDRVALHAWFEADEPDDLQPWQREGWLPDARAWIAAVLPDVSEIRQFSSWCNSCILRVDAPTGRAWFKAVHTNWREEPAITDTLARLLPGRTPESLAIDEERGWMLLGDLDGAPGDGLPVEERLGVAEALGGLHRTAVPLVEELLAGGCADRRADILATQIEALAADDEVPWPGDLRERFRSAVPRFHDLCPRLEDVSIPATLVHGDLHAGNAIRVGDRFVIFDWSDGCIADPFVDVLMFVMRMPEDAELRASFRDRYLAGWGLTGSDAAAYVELAEPLAAMHHAITYQRIHHAFSAYDRALFAGALPRWIDHALACPSLAR